MTTLAVAARSRAHERSKHCIVPLAQHVCEGASLVPIAVSISASALVMSFGAVALLRVALQVGGREEVVRVLLFGHGRGRAVGTVPPGVDDMQRRQ